METIAGIQKIHKNGLLKEINGTQRVIIENISPRVDGGQYPAKRAIGEEIEVSADIFSDGHDEIAASVHYFHENDPTWKELSLKKGTNDRWSASFKAENMGLYTFLLQAWIDHFTTWKKGIKKKFDAGQDISVDLLVGADMLKAAKKSAGKKEAGLLTRWINKFKNADQAGEAIQLALSAEVADLLHKIGDKSSATVHPQKFFIDVERKKALFSTWYELFPRSASKIPGQHGTFKDVEELLPRIAEMGFDTLYLPPIHPIGEKKRKGKNNALTADSGDPGSPWAIGNRNGGHKTIHPQLGTPEDFRSLIKNAEKYEIEIALDIAYQCAPDHPYVSKHPEWFRWRPDGTVQYAENPPKKYEDILPINFESKDWKNLWKELKSIVDYWISQGVKIFRVDNPHTKAFPFWEWMIGEVRKEHPEIIFLAEAFTRPRIMEKLAKIGFTQSYTYFTWRHSPHEFREYLTELTQTERRQYMRPNFWPNTPDILPPILTYGGEPAFIMRVILAATLSSNYGLYGPVYEFGIGAPHPDKEEYIDNEKYEIKHWEWRKYTRIKEVIARINRIRKENPALQNTWNIHFADATNEHILCFGKHDRESGNTVVVVVNTDPYHTHEGHVNLPLGSLNLQPDRPYLLKDLMSGDKYRWQDEWNYVKLDPLKMPAHVFKAEQL